MKKQFLIILVLVCGHLSNLFSQGNMPVRNYDLGDWLTIKNCNYVSSLSESQNYIFFGTSGGVIPYNKFEEYEEPAYTTSDGMADDQVSAVYFDNATRYLWAGHRKGVSYLSPVDNRWRNPIMFENKGESAIRIGSNNRNIFVETTSGILRLNNQTGNGTYGDNSGVVDNINWSIVSQRGSIELVGMYNINPEYTLQNNGIVKDSEFRDYRLNLMYVNNLNDIYGGVFGLGYIVGDENLKMFDIHPSGILKNFANTFSMSDDYLWVGSVDDEKLNEIDRTGVSEFNFNSGEWDYFEDYSIHELASGKVYDIAHDNEKLLIGTSEGLTIYDSKENDWDRLAVGDGLWDNEIKTVFIDDTLAFVGSDYGLNEINLKSGNVFRFPLTKIKTLTKVYKIVGSEKSYWVGTNQGIYSIDKKDKTVEHFDFYGRKIDVDAKIASNCYAIAADKNIVVFKGDNLFLKYDSNKNNWENLPNYDSDSGVHDMDLDGDYLWIGTDKGAKFFNVKTEENEKYSVLDGLAGNRVFKVHIDGDWVWFGTNRGLTKYNWRKYVLE